MSGDDLMDNDMVPGVPGKHARRREQRPTSEPGGNYEDVTGLRATATGDSIRLTWNSPSHSTRIVVVRRPYIAVTDIERGDTVFDAVGDVFEDRDIQFDVPYFYRVFALYAQFGRSAVSAGVEVQCISHSDPIPNLRLQVQETVGGVEITWDGGGRQAVTIVRSHRPPPFQTGAEILPAAADAWLRSETILPTIAQDVVQDADATAGLRYYTPLFRGTNVAVIGLSSRYLRLDPITNLLFEWRAGRLIAKWTWPAEATLAKIVGTKQRNPIEAGTHVTRITRTAYNAETGCHLSFGDYGPYEVTVFAGVNTPEGEEYNHNAPTSARGIVPFTRQICIRYTVRRDWLGCLMIELTADQPIFLRGLQLYTRYQNDPVSRNNGELVHTYDEIDLRQTVTKLSVPNLTNGHVFRLFHLTDEANDQFPIYHPPTEKRRQSPTRLF